MRRNLFCGALCILFLILSGCDSSVADYENIYVFPDSITQLKVTYGPVLGFETEEYIIEPDADEKSDGQAQAIIDWFYGLELEACEEPEQVDGNK